MMHKTRVVHFLTYAFIVYVGLNVFFATLDRPLSHDDAYNLQVAKSLSEHFVYQSLYFPRYIYDFNITTNGLIQYLAALDLKLLGDRFGLALTLALISVFVLGAVLKYSWKAFAVCIALMVSYWVFSNLMTVFLGDITTLGFLFLGVFLSQKQIEDSADSSNTRWIDYPSVICYGLAISTKFISAVMLPFILFGLFYSSNRFDGRLFLDSVKKAITIYLLSLAVFVVLFYFSVLHSQIALLAFEQGSAEQFVSNPGLVKFIEHHFFQQSTGSAYMLRIDAFSEAWVLPLLLACLVLLVTRSLGWVPLALMVVLVLAKGNLIERRMFLIIVPVFLLSAHYCRIGFRDFLRAEKKTKPLLEMIPSLLVVAMWAYVFAGGAYQYLHLKSINSNYDSASHYSLVWPKFGLTRSFFSRIGQYDNHFVIGGPPADFVTEISEAKSPVVVNGWWQFPVLQLTAGVSFYNRMELEVPGRLEGASPLLLFNPTMTFWPETSIEMCDGVVKQQPELVLCHFDMTLPLNHRWGVE